MDKDKVNDTWKTLPEKLVSTNRADACLIHIYPTGPGMGSRYSLGDQSLILGRDADCDIHHYDHSVSRRHVRIEPGMDGHYAVDLQSTNGTFVNDRPASMSKLKDGDYLRVGNWILRYLSGGNVESQYHEEIYRLTIIDGLTQIYNQRYLLEYLDRELARSARYHHPLSLVLFDIDRFKAINDVLGHLGGDEALRELSASVKPIIRKEELFARYGGEEFVVVLAETSHDGARKLAERLRQLIEKHDFQFEEHKYHLTISLGLASTGEQEVLTAQELIRRADANLYMAKESGRNRVAG